MHSGGFKRVGWVEKRNTKQKKTVVIMAGNPRRTRWTVTYIVIGHLGVLLCLCLKRVEVRNLSHQNEFCMQFHFHVNESHFHENGFALRLALKQRHKGTRKLSISTL